MFSVGDAVVYRHHVCRIASIRKNYYQGNDYLELHALFENSLKLFVSVVEAEPPALRPVMERDKALALIDSIVDIEDIDAAGLIKNADTPALVDRRIKEEYDKRLKSYAPEELLPIMKLAYGRSQERRENGRNATATDKRYFSLAEGLLCDELAVSLGVDREKIGDYLVERIEKATGTAL